MTERRQIVGDQAATNGDCAGRFERRLTMTTLKVWIASAIVLLAGAVAAADDALLESLDPATALADVRESRGVVFVDLYADW